MYKKIIILTGSGISAESGLATFRGTNGLWHNYPIEEVATHDGFLHNPEKVNQFYNLLRAEFCQAQPNAAHLAITDLQQKYPAEIYILTQNIDTLHEQAGNQNVLHIHGQINQAECMNCHCLTEICHDILPQTPCPECHQKGTLRPNIVLCGEEIKYSSQIVDCLKTSDLFIAIGTSGLIPPANKFVREATKNGAETIEFNLEPSANTADFSRHIFGKATTTLPNFIKSLLESL